TKAVQHFAQLLKNRYPDLQILMTSTTDTGHAEAKHSIPFADYHLFLPFDFSSVIKPIIKHIKPDLVILSETDYWFHFLTSAKSSGALVAVINGKLSEISLLRYGWMGRYLEA